MSLNKIQALEDFLKMEDSPEMSSRIMHVLQTEASGISDRHSESLGQDSPEPSGLLSEASLRSCR